MPDLIDPRVVRFAALIVLLLSISTAPAAAQSETIEYYGLDALGSVRVIFNAQGAVIDRMDYGPFGENLRAAIKFPVEQFAQLARDAESGQDYAQARNYSATTGRFNRVDSVYSGLFEPQRWNRYSYAANQPLSLIDPDGRDPFTATLLAAWCFQCTTRPPAGAPGSTQSPFRTSVEETDDFDPWSSSLSSRFANFDSRAGDWSPDWFNMDNVQSGLDALSIALDLTGVGAVVSPVVDLANAGVSLARGDTTGAGLSVVAAVPFVGSGANIARLTRQAQKAYPLKAGRELHHVIPQYLGGEAKGARVPLDAAYHQLMTNEFRSLWSYGQERLPDPHELQEILLQVYAKYPLPKW